MKTEWSGFPEVLARYHEALRRLAAWGIDVPDSSRLMTYHKRLLLADGNPSSRAPEWFLHQLLFDLREVDEITEIVESFASQPSDSDLRRLALVAAKGAGHPDQERNAAARDAQYELYLRAAFIRGGLPAILGDPDLTVGTPPMQFALEAKRPRSPQRLDDRTRDAVSQLAGRSSSGVVAISIDHLARPKGLHMVAPTVDDLDWIGDYMMDQFKAQHLDRVLKRIAGSRVAALLLTMRVQGWVEERGAPCLVTRSHVLGLLSASDPNFWIYERMSAVWAAGT